MKKIYFLCLFILVAHGFHKAQNSLWGTTVNGGTYGFGTLYRTDSVANNMVVVRHFNGLDDGSRPGPLMQASNGKLYGMTGAGGHGVVLSGQGPNGPIYTRGGTLFEYDPVLDSFAVLIHFNSTDPQYPVNFYSPSGIKLLEVSPGVLWAVLSLFENVNSLEKPVNRYVAAYTIATASLSPVVTIPSWTFPDPVTANATITGYAGLTGTLYKDASGLVYGTTDGYSTCALLSDANVGSIIQIDPATNAFSYIDPFSCNIADGYLPMDGNLEAVNGTFYSYTYMGGIYANAPNYGYGVIYNYDPATNTYAKHYDFAGGASGGHPFGYLVLANNGKLYGTADGGTPYQNFPNGSGVVYDFDPLNNVYTKDLDFVQNTLADVGAMGSLWLKSSINGKLYGSTSLGLFEFNTSTNLARPAARFFDPAHNTAACPVIEVCRLPAYVYQAATDYTVCEGSFFSYGLGCTNAQYFIWRHNGVIDATQGASTLSITAIGQADAGIWVCDMINDCGTTTSPQLSVTVNAPVTPVNTSTLSPAGNLLICPGSSITLSGNSGGVWSNGATTSSLVISQPGSYQVVNANSCGDSYSNIVTVDTVSALAASVISFSTSGAPVLTTYLCPGDSILLSGNTNGVWNTGQSSASIYVKDQLPHFVTSSTTCNSVNSATAQATLVLPPTTPIISAAGQVQICSGDSVLLQTNTGQNYNWYVSTPFTSYVDYDSQIYAKQTGDYFIILNAFCGSVSSQSVHIDANSVTLDTAIITALGPLNFCQGDSVTLQSNYTNSLWSTGATTNSLVVKQAGSYQVTISNSCNSVLSDYTVITTIAPPAVSYTELQDTVCPATPAFMLSAGIPSGGYYTGAGVSGNNFDASVAGPGSHTVTYHYLDVSTGCTGKTDQVIYVDGDPVITAPVSSTVCAGIQAILLQSAAPYGTWNNGQAGPVLTTSVAGTYYVTKTNACGATVTSNSIQVVLKPAPVIGVTPGFVCLGQATTLTANGAISYTWNTGAAAATITVVPTANLSYTISGTGTNGCQGDTALMLTAQALPPVAVNNAFVCIGGSVQLNASGASTYSWSTLQSGASITVSPVSASSYTVTGYQNGCGASAVAQVNIHPPAVTPSISLNGNALVSSPASSYQWYINGTVLPGATAQNFTPTLSGSYTIKITDANGCDAFSAEYSYSNINTGIAGSSLTGADVAIFPNPNAGHFTIRIPAGPAKISILTTLGQLIYQSTQETGEQRFFLTENGIYFIEIQTGAGSCTKKLIVDRN